jgi:hypothetical protein
MKIYLSCSQVATEPEIIRNRLGRLDCVFVVDKSTLGARSGPVGQVIISELTRSDLFIGVVGPDYGAVDDSLGVSLCEFEYREALLLEVPRLLYIENGFTMDPDAAALRYLIEQNDVPVLFHDSSVLITQIVTDVFNITFRGLVQKAPGGPGFTVAPTETASPAQSIAAQSIDDPDPIAWYRQWKSWSAKNLFPRSHFLRGLLQAVLFPLITVAALFKLYGVPQPIGDSVAMLNKDIAIFFGSPPRPTHTSIYDSFEGPSLDSTKWNGGATWKLIGAALPDKYDTLMVTGSDIGVLMIPDHFESFYDLTLSFQIPILNPVRQKSVAWLVRLEHNWRGDSYYRFNLKFPTSEDKNLHISTSLYSKGIANRSIGTQVISFYPFVRPGSALNVTTILSGSTFTVSVRYSDACFSPPCDQYNDGTQHDFVFDDPKHTLKWGLVGFTSSEETSETDIQNVQLIPVGSKANGN